MEKRKANVVTIFTMALMAAVLYFIWRGSAAVWTVVEILFAAYGFAFFGVNFRAWITKEGRH